MIEPFGPGWGNPSLRSIIEPEAPGAISLAPATPGWWALLLVLCWLLFKTVRRRRRRYARDRYRREALTRLADIERRLNAGAVDAARELAPLLRATAIAAAGRERFVGSRGEAYAAALARLSPNQDPLPLAEIDLLAYAPLSDSSHLDLDAIVASLEHWIEHHKEPDA